MSLFNLSGIVSMLGTHTVTVQRPTAVTFADGGFANTQSFTQFIVSGCSVQPVNGAEVVKPPEGTRPSETVSVHAPAFAFQPSDRLTVPGRGTFEVYHAFPWSESGNFSKALARQLNASEPRS